MTYFLIWYVPPFEQGKIYWYLIFYCLFQSMQTVSMSYRQTILAVLCSSCAHCAYKSLTVCLCSFAVLPCAIFSPHHVHQQRPEREGLCHCLSYVRAPVWSDCFTCVAVYALLIHFCAALRYDGGGAGHCSGHCNPGTDSRWRLELSQRDWCHRRHKLE